MPFVVPGNLPVHRASGKVGGMGRNGSIFVRIYCLAAALSVTQPAVCEMGRGEL